MLRMTYEKHIKRYQCQYGRHVSSMSGIWRHATCHCAHVRLSSKQMVRIVDVYTMCYIGNMYTDQTKTTEQLNKQADTTKSEDMFVAHCYCLICKTFTHAAARANSYGLVKRKVE